MGLLEELPELVPVCLHNWLIHDGAEPSNEVDKVARQVWMSLQRLQC